MNICSQACLDLYHDSIRLEVAMKAMKLNAWRGTKCSEQQPKRNERQSRDEQHPADVLENADAVTRRQLLHERDGCGKRQTTKDEAPEHAPRITRACCKFQSAQTDPLPRDQTPIGSLGDLRTNPLCRSTLETVLFSGYCG
jgi:hypothetical protein